jgi:hypothetical protein
MATDEHEDEHDPGVRPGAGPRQTDDDVASSLPPGGGRKADLGPRGDVDRQQPYDEEPTVCASRTSVDPSPNHPSSRPGARPVRPDRPRR